MKKLFLIFVIVTAAIGLLADFNLTLAHLNDTHSHIEDEEISLYFDIDVDGDGILENTKTKTAIGGFPRITSKINDLRAENDNFIFLHAGDVFMGTLYFTQYEGMADLWFLEHMQLDVMVCGNHEFDLGLEVLGTFATEADFPLISANIDVSGCAFLNGLVNPYWIKDFNGEQVGIIGITTEETPNISSPGSNVIFSDRIAAVQNAVTELNNQGIDKIIVLSHCGVDPDIEVAESVSGIDVIICGHDHRMMGDVDELAEVGITATTDYPISVEDPAGNDVLLISAWQYGYMLGTIDLTFDDNGMVTSYNGKSIVTSSNSFRPRIDGEYTQVSPEEYPEIYNQIVDIIDNNNSIEIMENNAEAEAQLEIFSEPIDSLYQLVVANVPEDLPHVRVPGWEYNGHNLPEGSHIAPLVCDGMLWKAQELGMGADIVIQNAGGVRIDIPSGDLTLGEAYELMPFGNTLCTIDLTGLEVKASIIEGVTGAVSRGTGAFPYVAGCRYDVDATDVGNVTINSLEVMIDGEYQAIEDNTVYTVVTNSFIVTGGDGYATFGENEFTDTGFVDAAVFVEFSEEMTELVFVDDGRITIALPVDDTPDEVVDIAGTLIGNYPNPFNPTTNIKFAVNNNNSLVSLKIYNVKGQIVKQFNNMHYDHGVYSISWNGSNDQNNQTASGVYMYSIQINDQQFNSQMIMLK